MQKRLAAAHFEEGELEALQDRQRIRIERHNSYRSERAAAPPARSGAAVQDLMDLNFDDDAAPRGASSSSSSQQQQAQSHARKVSQGGQNASLSDYSDYDSESDEEQHAPALHQGGGSKAAAVAEEEEEEWTHKPRIGPSSLYDYGSAGEDDDGADPFADPDDDAGASPATGFAKHTGPRKEFAAV